MLLSAPGGRCINFVKWKVSPALGTLSSASQNWREYITIGKGKSTTFCSIC